MPPVRDQGAAAVAEFRFRWRRRANWGTEAYDAWIGEFRVGQITPVQTHGSGLSYWAWRILLAPIAGPGSAGQAPAPREAARALEAAFPAFVQSAPRFAMQTEREVILRAALQLPHTVELDHALAVARGEHVRPVSVTDAAGWNRWLTEERRLGSRQWISPEEMREWFGDMWQDPREAKEETPLPVRALQALSAPRFAGTPMATYDRRLTRP